MSLAELVSVGLLRCEAGRIVWANDALVDLAGARGVEDLVDRSATSLIHDAGRGVPDWPCCQLSRSTGHPMECELARMDGERLRVRVRPLGRGAYEVRDVAELSNARTESLRLAAELHAARQEAEALSQTLGRDTREREEILAAVSHELQTPLTVLGGFTRLLLSEDAGSLTDEQRRYLEESQRSCERLTKIVSDLLAARGIPGAHRELELRPGSLDAAVRSVLGWLEPLARERGQAVELALAPNAIGAVFDSVRIEQVLINLLGNALKYGRPGGRVVVSSRRLTDPDPPRIEVSVEDDGPGVDAAERARIFEPYVRGERSAKGPGLGLGLAICRRIVEGHSGRIEVRPADGGGARFAFTLRAVPAGGDA